MASYNKIILLGNLTRDPQLSYLPSQTPVVEIGLAVNHRWRAQDGQQRESVCFIDCRSYGKQAEALNKYFRKGRPILIEGRLDFDQWEAQDGSKRSKHRVFIERFTFVDSGQRQDGGGHSEPQGQGNNYAPPQQQSGGYAPQQQQQPAAPPQAPAPDQSAPPPNSYDNPNGGEEIPF